MGANDSFTRPVVWSPQPGSQYAFLTCPTYEVLYEGTRGPGKTDALLMDFAQHCGQGFGHHWRGILFRETYPQLADVVAKSKRLFFRMFPGIKFNASDYYWTWPTGEQLYLRHMRTPDDYWSYHGHEYPWIGWEELTNWATSECYESMKACSRSSHEGMPRKYRATANPYGVGHAWVKEYFIDPAPAGRIMQNSRGLQRVRIKGFFFENTALMRADPEYVAKLESITDPNRRKAWLGADWNIVSGGIFDGVWRDEVHVIRPFEIPKTWRLDRSFDWGSSAPFSVGWWAVTDGSEVETGIDDEGEPIKRTFKRGTLIRWAEWYGWNGTANQGCRMLASEIARGILKKEEEMGVRGRVRPGPADSSIFDTQNGVCIADDMQRAGINWERADKSPGSRRNGWELMRDRLDAGLQFPMERPGLFVFDTCRHFIRTVPSLPRDDKNPDDVDCFVAGTMVSTTRGDVPVECIRVGDMVHTPIGPRRVIKDGISGMSPTVRIELADGRKLIGTPDHRVMVVGVGLVPLSMLQCGQTLMEKNSWSRRWFIEAWNTVDMMTSSTMCRVARCFLVAAQVFIVRCGLTTMGQYLPAMLSTTSTTTTTTTNYRILRSCRTQHTRECTTTKGVASVMLNGLQVLLENLSCARTLARCSRTPPSGSLRALIVESLLQPSTHARSHARKDAGTSSYLAPRSALFVVLSFLAKLIQPKRSRPVVTRVGGHSESELVFNLTVEQAHLFYANGILVTNTDAEDHCGDECRYRCLMQPRLASATALNL
jgi:hypothetical protein